jgi:hypothetical protein
MANPSLHSKFRDNYDGDDKYTSNLKVLSNHIQTFVIIYFNL